MNSRIQVPTFLLPTTMKPFIAIMLASLSFSFLSCAQHKQEDASAARSTGSNPVVFKRMAEPKEGAFTLLVPQGWAIEGGAIRIMDARIAGANNMIDCKFDLAVKSDAAGSIMLRWLPQMFCVDQSMTFGSREGAIFNNFLVRRKRSPRDFILEVAMPYAHPGATNVTVVSGKNMPGVAARYRSALDPTVARVTTISYQAYLLEYTYVEKGTRYQERMAVVLEDYGSSGGGLWKNRETMLIRAPDGQLATWEPVLNTVHNSCKWNMQWMAGEINGERKRSGKALATQRELQEIDRAIVEHRRATYAEINKDMYLNLTEQNEYKNPINGEIDVDTDHWKHRWINSLGDVIYSNDNEYNPNYDPNLHVSGYELTTPRNK